MSLAYSPPSSQSGSQCPPRRTRGSGRAWRESPRDAWLSQLCYFLSPTLAGLPSPGGLLSPEDPLDPGNLAKQEGKQKNPGTDATTQGETSVRMGH